MTCAETYGYRPEGSNPCRCIRRYRRRGRERFLSAEEIRRLGRVLSRHEENARVHVAIICLLLLTGCRSSEIVTLRWREYRESHLHLADAKTGPRMVWLSSPARRILDRQPRSSPWVFPSTWTGKSVDVASVGSFWRHIRSEAGLHDVRLHDLRRSYASRALAVGESLTMIGKLLGHTQVQTTARYAHLARDSILNAAARITGSIGGNLSPADARASHDPRE